MLKIAENAAWLAAFAFVIAFVAGMAIRSSNLPPHEHHAQSEQNPQYNYRHASTVGEKRTDRDAGVGSEDKKNVQYYWDSIVGFIESQDKLISAISSIFLIFFTGVPVLPTLYLYGATRDLVIGAEKTAEHQLRAYVFVIGGSVILDGNTLRGIVDIKNTGQTPAYDLISKVRMQTVEVGKPFEIESVGTPETFPAILVPGVIINPRSDLVVPLENTAAIPAFKEGRGIIYFIGETQCRDAFGKTWILNYKLRSFGFDGKQWILQPAETGNTEHQKN